MSQEIITNLVNAYFTHWEAMEAQGWLTIFTEDALIYDPVGKPPSKVQEEAPKFFNFLSSIFSQIQITQDSIFIAGNGAAVKWTMNVISKNNRTATSEGISVFTINDDGNKIQQVCSYWDDKALIAQLQ